MIFCKILWAYVLLFLSSNITITLVYNSRTKAKANVCYLVNQVMNKYTFSFNKYNVMVWYSLGVQSKV